MLLLHYFICIHYTVLSINAFILHQSFLQILAYQILSVMLVSASISCFGGSVFSEIVAVANCGK